MPEEKINWENVAPVCRGCFNFKVFGKKCWFYWEDKKVCTQFRISPEEESHVRDARVFPIELRL